MVWGKKAALPVFLLILVTGCQMGGSTIWQELKGGPEAEALAGRRAAVALEKSCGGVACDRAAAERVAQIGSRLAASTDGAADWQFQVLASDKINGYSLPGGLVYVTRGLYERVGPDEGALAAVLAHEMAHVLHRDSLKPGCATPREGLAREKRADRRGVRLLAAAGYHPRSMIDLLQATEDAHPRGWASARIRVLAQLPAMQTRDTGNAVVLR